MKPITFTISLAIAAMIHAPLAAPAESSSAAAAGTVVLDAVSVENLGIEMEEAEPTDFQEVLFALGRIEVIPSQRGIVSSRVPGRVSALEAFEGDPVRGGQVVARIQSRQPGNPPPTIELTAPLGGLVVENLVSLGEPVEPATPIMEILDLSSVYAVARVPEDQAGQLRPGVKARIHIAALPAEAFEGEMLRFGTSANPTAGTVDAVFRLDGLNGSVRPDMRAEFSILLERREGVMAVPREAIQGDAASPYVFVKHFDLPNAFVRAPVTLGSRNDRLVEVLRGLLPGDEVVTRGAYPLAFAGEGSISLKDALDAAHGHEHNPDGSEITPKQRSAGSSGSDSGGVGASRPGLTLFLALLSGFLLVLLILSIFFRRGPVPADA